VPEIFTIKIKSCLKLCGITLLAPNIFGGKVPKFLSVDYTFEFTFNRMALANVSQRLAEVTGAEIKKHQW